MTILVSDYPNKGKDRLYDGYFEFVEALSEDIAAACNCDFGQTVARVYKNGGGCVAEFAGSREDAENFVKAEMAKLKVV